MQDSTILLQGHVRSAEGATAQYHSSVIGAG